jgi:mannose-6-phosphate isomerase
MERANYPLLLTPHLAERIWGGSLLGEGIGEAWDLSVHPHGPARIANGPLAGETLAAVVAAHRADFGGPIDLLAKRLDCAHDLSVQVHPKEGDPKTESWVVLHAEPGAGVYLGFVRPVEREEVRAAALDGSLPELMRFVPVREGDCVFVPSGTLHAIGGGLLLFELQQSADTTYRLFDWGRGRELHLDQGLACAELTSREALTRPREVGPGRTRLVECDHFFVDRVDLDGGAASLDPGDRWVAVLALHDPVRIGDLDLPPASTAMIPTAAGETELGGAGAALVYGPSRSTA